jgi:septal ring factor EnvC (AmiA/AmiB activator)
MPIRNEDLLIEIRNKITDGSLSEKSLKDICHKAVTQANQIKQKRAQQQEEARKRHEQYTKEQNKPQHRFIEYWNYKHVYLNLLNEYCQTYSLTELEKFADELRKGEHRYRFRKGDSVEALAYLESWINARQPKNPAAEKVKLLREAKTEREEISKNIKKLESQQKEIQQTAAELEAKIKNAKNDKTSPNYVR